MSFSHRPDPLDRRITEAFEEIAGSRRPTYLDEILQRTAREPQRPAWTSIFRRPQPMNRLTYALVAAAVVAVLAGGALFFRATGNVGPPTTPSPAQSSAPAFAPESLRSTTWLATTGASASPGPSSLSRLAISADGARVSVYDAHVESFMSSPVGTQTAELDLVSIGPAGGCQVGDLGRYTFALSPDGSVPASDGTLLALTVVSDTCAARAAALGRTWVHAIDDANKGGRGVSGAFAPMFFITLPPADYTAGEDGASLTVTSSNPDRTLIAVKNPVGWNDPCLASTKLPITPTIKAFTAYMRTLPGFTVQSTALQIDGHPAVLLTIPSTKTTDCPGNRVNEWSVPGPGTGGWVLHQGETDVVYLVEVDGNLVLLQWLGAGVTTAEEQALFATVRFTETLPQ